MAGFVPPAALRDSKGLRTHLQNLLRLSKELDMALEWE